LRLRLSRRRQFNFRQQESIVRAELPTTQWQPNRNTSKSLLYLQRLKPLRPPALATHGRLLPLPRRPLAAASARIENCRQYIWQLADSSRLTSPSPYSTRSPCAPAQDRPRSFACRVGWHALCRLRPSRGNRERNDTGPSCH